MIYEYEWPKFNFYHHLLEIHAQIIIDLFLFCNWPPIDWLQQININLKDYYLEIPV